MVLAVDLSDRAKGGVGPLTCGPCIDLGDGQFNRYSDGRFSGILVAVEGLAALASLTFHGFTERTSQAYPLALAARLMLPC